VAFGIHHMTNEANGSFYVHVELVLRFEFASIVDAVKGFNNRLVHNVVALIQGLAICR